MRPWHLAPILCLAVAGVRGATPGLRPLPAPPLQRPTFSAGVEAVLVDVLVTDHGQPVQGLRPTDFEVRDNGVLQQVDLLTAAEGPVNVVLALDMSDSVTGSRLDDLRRAGGVVLDAMKPEDRAALVTFSHSLALNTDLSDDLERVRTALSQAEGAGSTGLVDASYAAMLLGEADVGRALVIVFSDGLDTSSWLMPDEVLNIARRGDAVVYGVSTGRLPRGSFLRELSALTGGTLVEIASTENLNAVFLGVLDEFRQRYLISYSPENVATSGWHQLDVRIKGRAFTVKARPGYLLGS